MNCLLRIEVVNLEGFVFDTTDLSTIRGGGISALSLPEEVKFLIKEFEDSGILAPPRRIERVSRGASSALFRLEASRDEAERIAIQLRERLAVRSVLRFATVVVDVVECTGSKQFPTDRNRVLARNRWSQLGQMSLVVPDRPKESVTAACSIDGVRPGEVKDYWVDGTVRWLSHSVRDRRKHGREFRSRFYEHETDTRWAFDFVQDLEQISDWSGAGSLDGKVAIIHLDGNRFGSAQASLAEPELKNFDKWLQKRRTRLLKRVLREADESLAGRVPGDVWFWQDSAGSVTKRCRIETLLWGGDEITWVVPAWLGWRVLEIFFECTRGDARKTDGWNSPDLKGVSHLTHAIGVVFCHHKSPIWRTRALAERLAGEAKSIGKKLDSESFQKGHCRDVVCYQVLESFDDVGGDFEQVQNLRSIQSPEGTPDRGSLALFGSSVEPGKTYPAERFRELGRHLRECRKLLPRRKVHEIGWLLPRDSGRAQAKIAELITDTQHYPASMVTALESAQELLTAGAPTPRSVFLHLNSLWDYLIDPAEFGREEIRGAT